MVLKNVNDIDRFPKISLYADLYVICGKVQSRFGATDDMMPVRNNLEVTDFTLLEHQCCIMKAEF